MAILAHYPQQSSSPRALAMLLALVSAVVLSPLYVDHRKSDSRLETRWSTGGLVLPVVVAGLIVAIRTTNSSHSSSNSNAMQRRAGGFGSGSDDSAAGLALRIGSSSWGLAGILIMLLFVTSWQSSVQHFLWR